MKVTFIVEGSDLVITHKIEQQLSQTKDVLFCRRKKNNVFILTCAVLDLLVLRSISHSFSCRLHLPSFSISRPAAEDN